MQLGNVIERISRRFGREREAVRSREGERKTERKKERYRETRENVVWDCERKNK